MESLVIVDQHATVNLYLSLVLTARHALEVEWIGSISCFIIKSVIFASLVCFENGRSRFGYKSGSTMICLVTGAKS